MNNSKKENCSNISTFIISHNKSILITIIYKLLKNFQNLLNKYWFKATLQIFIYNLQLIIMYYINIITNYIPRKKMTDEKPKLKDLLNEQKEKVNTDVEFNKRYLQTELHNKWGKHFGEYNSDDSLNVKEEDALKKINEYIDDLKKEFREIVVKYKFLGLDPEKNKKHIDDIVISDEMLDMHVMYYMGIDFTQMRDELRKAVYNKKTIEKSDFIRLHDSFQEMTKKALDQYVKVEHHKSMAKLKDWYSKDEDHLLSELEKLASEKDMIIHHDELKMNFQNYITAAQNIYRAKKDDLIKDKSPLYSSK